MSSARSDAELLAEVLRRRAHGVDPGAALGELCERWRRPACFVVRRIQASYGRGSPDDELELFQDAVRKLLERGLDQYRGDDPPPAAAAERLAAMRAEQALAPVEPPASPVQLRTFFLRIVKHQAIDHYRARREELAPARPEGEEAPEAAPAEIAHAVELRRRVEEREDASAIYWAAFAALERDHPNEAEVWRLYHHEGIEDHAECAARLSISVVNSYKRLSRAQAYLKLYAIELETRDPAGGDDDDD
jgi:RNA polymerase sigma-70 factor (ECF subfamily)